MTKPNLSRWMKSLTFNIGKYSPEILTGIGIAGMVTTTVLAVKATPKAMQIIEDMKVIDKNTYEVVEPTKTETFKACWKCYLPAAITGATSIACLIGASSVNAKRNAALATAYKLSETALLEYRDKVVESIGEKKEHAIRDKVTEDKLNRNPITSNEVIITGKGETLCYDAFSGRYFKSDIDKIKRAENEFNRRLLNEIYLSLNDFYDELGLEHTDMGNKLGWSSDSGRLIDIYYSSQLAADGTPCLSIDYSIAPKYDYDKLYS